MPEPFTWSSAEGHLLCRKILRDSPLPYEPHDYQIEGVCKSLDGVDLCAITPTGSGKTGYYTMYMLVVLAVVKDPKLCPTSKFPENPLLIIICPTIPLQLDMASKMSQVGIKVSAINSETRDTAQRLENLELWVKALKEPSVIIAGPEQLKCKEFEKALRHEPFYDRCCGLGFDEVHLLNVWGPHFRKDFLQMGFLKARLNGKHNPWILTSATIRDGPAMENISNFLGLHPGEFHLIRRSNYRPEVQMLFRELTSPIGGDSFPELNWILQSKRSTLIFAKTISLGYRIYAYLFRKAERGNRRTRIRMYNSLNWESHNAETRDLLHAIPDENNLSQIVIGTDTLSVGIDTLTTQDVVMIGDIDDPDELFQKSRRPARHPEYVTDGRAIVYISRSTRLKAERTVAGDPTGMDLDLAKLIVGGCIIKSQNEIYGNPPADTPCTCPTCTKKPPLVHRENCNCSVCLPENIPPIIIPPHPKPNALVPKRQRLTKLMRAHGTTRLIGFRHDVFLAADKLQSWRFPIQVFFPDKLMGLILDQYALIDSVSTLSRILGPYPRLKDHHDLLFTLLQSLQSEFDAIQTEQKLASAEKRRAKKAAEADMHSEPEASGSGTGSCTTSKVTKKAVEKAVDPSKPKTVYQLFLSKTMAQWKLDHPTRTKEAYEQTLKLWADAPENKNRGKARRPGKSKAIPDVPPDDDEVSDEGAELGNAVQGPEGEYDNDEVAGPSSSSSGSESASDEEASDTEDNED